MIRSRASRKMIPAVSLPITQEPMTALQPTRAGSFAKARGRLPPLRAPLQLRAPRRHPPSCRALRCGKAISTPPAAMIAAPSSVIASGQSAKMRMPATLAQISWV